MRRLALHHWILIAMVAGAAIGLPLNWAAERGALDPDAVRAAAEGGKALGDIFLRALQMLVIPLIVASLISGVTGMGDLRQLGRLGVRTLGFYLVTSLLAITTGLILVNLISPGVGAEQLLEGGADLVNSHEAKGVAAVLWEQFNHMIPNNPLAAAAQGDVLPVIFFSLLLGIFINLVEHGDGNDDVPILRRFFSGLFQVMMRMTLAVIWLAPIGVFGFMLYAAAGKGLSAFQVLGWYALTVALGLLIHAGITLPLILRVAGQRSPLRHLRDMRLALLTAFGTASSNGTLPLTMQCVEKEAGVRPEVSAFTLPLGATINMDGTALYEAVAVLFIAQVYGLDLSVAQQVIVALTALLASIGAAGIPHAGTVMMVVVLNAVGLPTTAVGLVLAVDRVLDMARTAVNVWSDSIAAVVVNGMTTDSPERA